MFRRIVHISCTSISSLTRTSHKVHDKHNIFTHISHTVPSPSIAQSFTPPISFRDPDINGAPNWTTLCHRPPRPTNSSLVESLFRENKGVKTGKKGEETECKESWALARRGSSDSSPNPPTGIRGQLFVTIHNGISRSGIAREEE